MNGYAEITIGEKKVGVKYGMESLRLIQEKSKSVTLVASNGELTEVGMSYIMYAGYKNWCIVKEVTEELKYEDFYNHTELVFNKEADADEFATAIRAFSESKVIKTTVPAQDVKKKKSTLKK